MKRILFSILWLAGSVAAALGAEPAPAPAGQAAAQAAQPSTGKPASNSTADHSKFKVLQGKFATGPDVTKACLSCHTEAAKQVMKTSHWTWDYLNPDTGQRLGKKNVINNFCTAVPSNYAFCTACHVGYDWRDASYDFSREDKVDCVVCHDTTGTYRKLPGLAGHPAYKEMEFPPGSGRKVQPVDLTRVAQNVGKTSRATCGACHFLAGGGDSVKHGDLDTTLKTPGRYLDVHMDTKGLNFTCATCHVTSGHVVSGSRYAPTADDRDPARIRGKDDKSNPATCQACHGQSPHKAGNGFLTAKLNEHTDKLACQTCHIPEFARGQPTKMSWDWSTAGRLREGKPFTTKDSGGEHDAYDSKKGSFRYEGYVIPEYVWFNGKVRYTLLGDKVDVEEVTKINRFEGSATDGKSRIWPTKLFRGRQPYDLETQSLLVPHTATGYGEKDDTAYWQNFKWEDALKAGADATKRPFGGKFGFVATQMSWPITHMVAPKEDALTCIQCHSSDGRLARIDGVYMPGRDHDKPLEWIGWLAALGALVGTVAHGGLRYLNRRKV